MVLAATANIHMRSSCVAAAVPGHPLRPDYRATDCAVND
jgi:hypothetical protein